MLVQEKSDIRGRPMRGRNGKKHGALCQYQQYRHCGYADRAFDNEKHRRSPLNHADLIPLRGADIQWLASPRSPWTVRLGGRIVALTRGSPYMNREESRARSAIAWEVSDRASRRGLKAGRERRGLHCGLYGY